MGEGKKSCIINEGRSGLCVCVRKLDSKIRKEMEKQTNVWSWLWGQSLFRPSLVLFFPLPLRPSVGCVTAYPPLLHKRGGGAAAPRPFPFPHTQHGHTDCCCTHTIVALVTHSHHHPRRPAIVHNAACGGVRGHPSPRLLPPPVASHARSSSLPPSRTRVPSIFRFCFRFSTHTHM